MNLKLRIHGVFLTFRGALNTMKSIKCVLIVKGRGEGAVECLGAGERALDALVPSPLLLALILSYMTWSGQLSEDSSR